MKKTQEKCALRPLSLLAASLWLVGTPAVGQTPAERAFVGGLPRPVRAAAGRRKFPAWPKGCARFEGEEKTACLDAVASDFGGFYRYAAANAALAAPKPGEPRVVFFGDSITDNWSKPDYGGFFPGQALRQPRHRRTDDGPDAAALPRRRSRAAAEGRRDPRGDQRHRGQRRPRHTRPGARTTSRAWPSWREAHGIRVVLASLLPVSDDKQDANGQPLTRTRQRPTAALRELNRWLAAYAAKNGHVYLDYFSATADAQRPAAAADSTTTACTRTPAATP